MDPITDVFNTMHVTSVVHAKLEATAPWGLIREVEDGNGAALHSAASENPPCQFAHFGMVSRGNCWLSVGGLPDPLPLTGGHCFLPAPGAEVMVNRPADILVLQCVRAHITYGSENCKSGWLRAIFDPKIGAALKAMHEQVENPWTVAALASAAGLSRSAFALRFKELLRETPLEYLTNWRMYKATGFLQDGDKKLFEVAKSVGYDSDAAFSKAFKRVLGVTPREHKRRAVEALQVELAESAMPSLVAR